VDTPSSRPLRVAFVVCPPYHGATLLALLLNNHSQISALGDMLPLRGVEQICACGRPSSECDFWKTVRNRLDTSSFPDLPTLLPLMPWPLLHHQVEWSTAPVSPSPRVNRAAGRLAVRLVDLAAPVAWAMRGRAVRDFVETYVSFYRLVLEEHGTAVFVDGTKNWRKVALLARNLEPSSDVRIVHLVRDPRGFAASLRRHGRTDLREAGWLWADLHDRMASLREAAEYRLLRYELLCAQPEQEMRELFRFLGVEPKNVVTAPKYPHKHHVLGNQMFRTFSGSVRLDERWRSELSPAEQRTVLGRAGSLADRLGYRDDG
jgi:hypothetical protein